MSASDLLRLYFVPGDGIDRRVISADIQRYLGSDATVRPGVGSGEHEGVQGYWIRAYRNLTSAMIADLKQDSGRWRQEQTHGNRGIKRAKLGHPSGSTEPDSPTGSYENSQTHYNSNVRDQSRAPTGSPSMMESPYGAPPPPVMRPQYQYDNPYENQRPPPSQNYGFDRPPPREYDSRYAPPQDGRPYPSDPMRDPMLNNHYGQPPPAPQYDPRPGGYQPGYGRDGPMPGSNRPSFPPSGPPMYDTPSGPGSDRYNQPSGPPRFPNGQPPPGRDQVGYRPQDYPPPNPSNVYPSPALSNAPVSGTPMRDPMRDAVANPPSMYNNGQPSYDQQYDRRKYR